MNVSGGTNLKETSLRTTISFLCQNYAGYYNHNA